MAPLPPIIDPVDSRDEAAGGGRSSAAAPKLSVVIPVYNEEAVLPTLFARLYPALDALGRSYEVLFVNDGSRDRSAALLKTQFEQRPDVTRVVLFAANFGQHRAILAGFAQSRGRYVLTLDADLQNPPEEIPRVLAELDAGHDYVGTIRIQRKDVAWRRYASRLINWIRERTTRVRITDHGCMFRGYARAIVEAVNQCSEYNTFVPALAYTFAMTPTEILVAHEDRGAGVSKYSLFRLMKLNFDLMTGFSTAPMQWFSAFGIAIAILSVFFVLFLLVRRLVLGPEAEGVFTLFAIAFFLIGVALFGVGLLGEYVSRIYDEVRHRPRYIVGAVLERPEDEA
jgi:undecaprenyl-phosphate 4-deoxy-4-formamido-L-arabinose transferase